MLSSASSVPLGSRPEPASERIRDVRADSEFEYERVPSELRSVATAEVSCWAVDWLIWPLPTAYPISWFSSVIASAAEAGAASAGAAAALGEELAPEGEFVPVFAAMLPAGLAEANGDAAPAAGEAVTVTVTVTVGAGTTAAAWPVDDALASGAATLAPVAVSTAVVVWL